MATKSRDSTKETTLVELLSWRAAKQPDRPAYTFLRDGEEDERCFSYQQLDQNARAIAAMLQRCGIGSGERALLLYPAGLDYVAAFFGCLFAGVAAVPAYPPRPRRPMTRLDAILRDAQPAVVLTTTQILSDVQNQLGQGQPTVVKEWLATDEIDMSQAEAWKRPKLENDTLAFLQYTSGSTSTPKGVMVSHGNLIHNEQMIQHAFGHTEESTFVGWLPMFHDMGLIGNVLQPLYIGAHSILMSPMAFLQKPVRWLRAVSLYKARTSGAPNFAYDLCVDKITSEQRATLDLRSWSLAFNGAEPVRQDTMDRFASAFEGCGFRRESFYPCYGLAEATLFVSGGVKQEAPVVHRFQAAALEKEQAAVAPDGDKADRAIVSCGRAWLDQEIVIADPDSCRRLGAGQIGEIWVSGQNVAQRYWNLDEESQRTFQAYLTDSKEGPFLRTGDLGFFHEGELFIAGRLKDLIIIRGRNHFPQDIEQTVADSHQVLQPGCGAAFSVDVDGDEQLVVVQEVTRHYRKTNLDGVIGTIREVVADEHEVQVHCVALIKPGSIPRTSSGKIQRRACLDLYLDEKLKAVALDLLEEGTAAADSSHVGQELYHGTESQPGRAGTSLLRTALAALGEEQRKELLQSHLCDRVAQSLRCSPSRVDVQRPLGSLGLDSLRAVELQHGIEVELGITIPMADVLSARNIAELTSEVLAQMMTDSAPGVALQVSPKEVVGPSMSRGQEALWFLQQLSPDSATYNIAYAMRIRSPLDTTKLKRTFQILTNRHPCLRTRFRDRNGKPWPEVQGHEEVSFLHEDATSWNEARLEEYLVRQAHRPFDLEQGPLWRAHLLTRSTHEHVLSICLHHISVDFWSLVVLMDELGQLYAAENPKLEEKRLPPPTSYLEFAQWQNQMLSSDIGQEHERYWQQQLAGNLPVLDLPIDHPRPATQTHRGASHSFQLDQRITQSLWELAKQEEVTLYRLLLSAFQALLCRYTGQTDVVVGSPVAGRSRAGFEKVVGYFANMVVMRGDLSEDPTFTELLSRTRKTVLEALAHQDFPFALLVDRLEQARDPSRSPIFQTVFVLEKPHMREELAEFVLGESGATMALGELQLESLALEQRVAQFDLTFMMVETSRGLGASIQYNSDLFETSTISRMANHFQTLVEGVLSNPGQRLSELPLLSSEEQRLLAEWKGAAGSVSPETSLQGLFEDQVSHNPEVVALVLEDQQVTYRELNIRANQLARYLKKLGVGPEVLVGICMDRSLEMIVAILGILKAGGAYFPLDPNYPEERLSFMLQDGQVSLVLCKKPWTQGLPPEGTQVLALDSHAAEISRESIQNPPPSSSAENLAYVMYTSGSTGVPNGVAVCQRSIIRLVQDPNYVELSADDVVLQFAPHTFDAATFEVWASLLHGGKLVLLHHEKPSLEQLSQALARHRISTLWLTSGLFHQMVDHELDGLRSVRQLLAGGDVLSVPHVQKVLDHVPSCRLINGYGPTENTTFTCCHPLEGNQALASSSVPIGRPINGTQVFVLTGHLQPVPVGVTAELIASGTGLARGYLGRPALTAEKFVPGAFSEQPGSRLYKTGDLVRYLEDGSIEFVGRVDDQLKVRGFRVETGEIEIVLTGHPAVRESVVVAEQEATTKRLVAYLVAEPAAPSASQLRDYLRERLPEYMVPAVFMTLDSLPLTANGKVDRRGLPAPGQTRPELDNQFVTPQQGTEAQLAEIWSELLGVERVGRYDDFFELGGHSLIGTQVISRVRQVTGVDLPLRSLFENPTVAGLAKRIGAARQGEENGPEAHPLLRTARDAAPDLSFTQERLWFLEQLVLGEPIYNIPAAIRLEGLLNVAALEQALEEIRRRHEVLRMGFLTVDGRPVPVVRGASACAAPMTDLRGLSGSARSAAMQGLTRVEALRAFDAAEDPLIRFSLVKTGQAEHVLFITMHHIVSDGWSIGILIRELGMLYDAFCSGKASQLAELSIEYRDFAHWQREWLQGPALDEQLDYWKQALAGVKPELELPIDRRRPALPSYKGSVCSVVLPPDLVEALHAFGQRHGFTLFMILLGALKIFLARLTKQDDLVVGTVTSGRTRAETESLIGCFMNFLPLRSRLSGDETGLCFLQQVRTSVLDADAHQECPFQKIVEAVQPDRSSSQNPLFNVAFLLENYPRSDFSSDTLKAVPLPPDRQISLLDLRFVASESATETLFSCEYSTDLFDVQTIQLLLDSFRSTLEKLVHEPETKVRSFPLSEALGVKAEPETVAITATFTAEPVEESLAFWAGKLEVPFKTEFAPYGQVFQELLAPDSLFAANQKGLNVVLVRLEDWEKSYTRLLPKVSPGEKERILADQARFTLPNRVEIAHLNRYETEYLYEEIFVDQVYLKHGIELRDGDCVFDVGANIGLFTLFVQQRLQNATIHAFEPAPHTFEILRTNAELYGQNVNLHHCGLADEDKTATFTFYPRSSVFSSFHAGTGHDTDAIRAVVLNAMKKADSGNGDSLGAFAEEFLPDRLASQEFTTQLRTLSGVVRENNIDQIDLLKIDVKRSELAVLHGIDIHTWKVIKQVVIEVHDPEGPLLNEVIRLLRTNGFEAEVEEEELLQGSGLFNIYATRRGRDTTDFQKQEPEPPDAVELQKKVEELIHAVGTAAQTGVTPHLVCICPASPAARMDPERSQRYERMEEFLASGLEGVAGVTVLKPAQLAAAYPVADYFDPHADELGHIPYTREFFASLGTSIARHMSATKAPPRKVIVLDCDQTLWKGVCAEDGAEGVAIDPPRRALQEFMLAQHDAGKLLCLCSKNSEMDVADVFDRHSEMPLRRDHFVSWRVNWHPKSENIRSLSEELQLGLDSFIFIDDSPIECAEVRSAFPEVLTLQLPEVPEQIPVFLNHVWAFDQVETTAEDKRRTALYRQNVQRERARKKSSTFADFLTDLNLDVRIDKMSALQLSRISQLSHRTNQFNVSKQARSESELETICKRSDIECLTVQVTDRFGDYGLVGVLLFQHDAGQIAVDTFLLSCRVLGRGVEHRMLARLGEIATRQGLTQICIPWNPNGRNQPALTFLNSLGAQHRQSRGESFDFLIPASHTLDVTFQPDVVVTRDPVDVSEKRPAAAADQVWNSARQLLAEVGLFDVERILKAIETDKRIRTRSRRKVAFVAPRNEVERLISGVWEQLLQLDQVGIHDHFFDMGGHSLLATQALSRLCDAFQVNLPLQSVFDSPTVAAMASTIARARVEGEGRATPPVKRLGQQDELPLSFAQERLWFLDQLEPGSHLYNVPVVLRLTGRLNSALLQGALAQILRRHEVLRTSFTSVDGRPQQVILESPPLPFRLIDLRRVSRADVRPWVVEEAQRLFDLTQGPLLRAALLKMADDEHVVVLTMHHIVSDGWSSGVLAHELAALYEGLSEGLPSRLPELPVQYKDFTVWQRKWLDGARLESELSYWKEQLKMAPPALNLPTDFPRPAVPSYRGHAISRRLPESLCEALAELARQERVTSFMTLLAAFQVMLSRHTSQDDIVVGTTIANRMRPELEGLVGFFANTLPLRLKLEGNPPFQDVLRQVRHMTLEAYAHQDLPFEKLVEAVQPDRDMNRTPIFQVAFELQNALSETLPLPGLQVELEPIATLTAKYDLSLFVVDSDGRLNLRIEYNTDLFGPASVNSFLERFEILLGAVVDDPQRPISDLPLLSKGARQQLLQDWNKTAVELPAEPLIHRRFEVQVQETPDAVAIVSKDQQLTYRELNTKANQLAHHLQMEGVGPDVLVGIYMERAPEMVVGLLGVLKAGGAYLPLDPSYPQERLRFMLEDSKASIVLTQEHLQVGLPKTSAAVHSLDSEWTDLRKHGEENLTSPVTHGNLAYAIYTSGSTGRPKGAMIEHRAIANHMNWMCRNFPLSDKDAVLQKTPISFDASVWEFYAPLLSGARLVLARPNGHQDVDYLFTAMEKHGVTTLQVVPTLLRVMLQQSDQRSCRSLKRFFCGGELLAAELRDLFFDRFDAELHNLYGPTETCIESTVWSCERGKARSAVPIGRPIDNTQVYLLDTALNPIPVGVPGEVHIAGLGVGRGYWNRSNLTAERFIPNPFSHEPGDRMYGTGDLALYRPDGTIEFLGRRDHQTKVRGFRIELGEIEALLGRQPGVRETVVAAREDRPGDQRLVAYFTVESQSSSSIRTLRRALQDQLPDFMVPSSFVLLDALPLTANGKVDRRALPVPRMDRSELEEDYVAPGSDDEKKLADIVAEVLALDRVGAHDNFFELGGHSLLASSHPETHYLSFLKGCFSYQIQRFMGDSIGRQQGSGGRVLQMQFSTNTSPSKSPSIMASSDSFTTVAGPTPTD